MRLREQRFRKGEWIAHLLDRMLRLWAYIFILIHTYKSFVRQWFISKLHHDNTDYYRQRANQAKTSRSSFYRGKFQCEPVFASVIRVRFWSAYSNVRQSLDFFLNFRLENKDFGFWAGTHWCECWLYWIRLENIFESQPKTNEKFADI